jgi:oligoendopeptidase F
MRGKTMSLTGLRQTWDLDVFFKGGSESPEFAGYISELEQDLQILNEKVADAKLDQVSVLKDLLNSIEDVASRLHEGSAFISCLTAQDMNDKKALSLRAKFGQMRAVLSTSITLFDEKLSELSDETWNTLLADASIAPYTFILNEKRRLASEKLPFEQEALINDLAVDGYHGWSNLYDLVVGKMEVPFEENGEIKNLSISQLSNKLGSQNKEIRDKAFEAWENAWEEQAEFCAEALNRLAGFRLNLYKKRGWDSVLKEPLEINRMSSETLDTMWQVITVNKQIFVDYLDRKAKLLGLEKLGWNDLDAPIGKTESKMQYDDAANFITEQFAKLTPKMAKFTEKAFKDAYIEAEDRAGKRPGGFCTSFPLSNQSRIFMTYSGTPGNVSTLAHELGHGFHQNQMDQLPYLNQRYAMNVAETASTFAEMVVSDAAVEHASSEDERLALLEDKIQRSVAFFMNIHARFLFETRFYEERKNGMLSTERLSQLMKEAQEEAFCGGLSTYHPSFWASKLHFYITGVPFYNFPYTFGYLFSAGIYAKAKEEGEGFEEKYIALLQDTGTMRVEDLAQKHLNVDLTKPNFWQAAVDLAVKDVEEFLELTK